MVGESLRFNEKVTMVTPGPGTYNTVSVENAFIVPTHNVLLKKEYVEYY